MQVSFCFRCNGVGVVSSILFGGDVDSSLVIDGIIGIFNVVVVSCFLGLGLIIVDKVMFGECFMIFVW